MMTQKIPKSLSCFEQTLMAIYDQTNKMKRIHKYLLQHKEEILSQQNFIISSILPLFLLIHKYIVFHYSLLFILKRPYFPHSHSSSKNLV